MKHYISISRDYNCGNVHANDKTEPDACKHCSESRWSVKYGPVYGTRSINTGRINPIGKNTGRVV